MCVWILLTMLQQWVGNFNLNRDNVFIVYSARLVINFASLVK